MNLKPLIQLTIAIAIAELAGIIGSFFTVGAIDTWYAGIVKPAWNPPAWVFGPVWVVLYAMMGVAVWLVWRKMDSRRIARSGEILKQVQDDNASGNDKLIKAALWVFGVQLGLNALWSTIFFGLHSPGWAFVEIVLLWAAIVGTIGVFWRISKPAALLLVPYILWVSFAGYLNYTIWDLNKIDEQMVFCTADAM
ncbi:hypothetical protein A2524_01710 [Candidatus Wolfebacteria bacterium RIFOXYD12_FULL_48_21]|uniref:TspO protein n=1 Tax=Candidatus Wolfebacteria bacterium RIFOXYD1_FULL_48_65 TaxID=1802561 RepID=A0A1F8DZS3_9BACT|nr:MAG: hypothetical protein A2610_03685 [Candidatus Wolfebacteria bacterium RIFOXYD1_FULL_48_65]OGM94515.1 MAG: hypothetical protein A2524_01710 [Candidatus Wolfebacteria bacterium RIFOXYD12_FULL_48_21]OGM96701.1 MAG: hypothetical protein A2532_04055 [Candidatus Wolfebacteria bacterium RIFOXYD2_FULL_48_11]